MIHKSSFTYYYVQAQEKDKSPEIVHHSKDDETGQHYYKFLKREKAKALRDAEKKLAPDTQFRVVKLVENYTADSWI